MASPIRTDNRAQVLASPAYQERANNLFELFCASRQKWNSRDLLGIQAAFAELLLDWQKKQREFKSSGDQLGVSVTRRLTLILQRIADSIAWRTLGYDRVLIQLLAEHPKTGFLDTTILNDFEEAQRIIENDNATVLVNDLTTTLRYGDLTVIYPDKRHIGIVETKSGKGSRRSGHANRQKKNLNDLTEFLNTGSRISKDGSQDYVIRVDVPLQTHHLNAEIVIKQARQDGYFGTAVNDCLAIEAVAMEHPNARFPRKRPFDNILHTISGGNLDDGLFEKAATRIAPYGIFPFDNQTCFDLITGRVQLVTTINFDALIGLFAQFGLSLELPHPSQQEIETYLSASTAKRKEIQKRDRSSWFVIRDRSDFHRISPDNWGKLVLELFHENTIASAHKFVLTQLKNRNIAEDRITRLYLGYKNEASIWS